MTGTISFGGIGSGMDTEGIVTGLVSAESGRLNALKTRATNVTSANSTLSDIGRYLSSLRTATLSLDTIREASGFAVSSSSSTVVASVTGAAMPGAVSIEVSALAAEQRTYSKTFASKSAALGQTGTLSIAVGSGTAVPIAVESTDTLEGVAGKINAAGLRVTASVFSDGTTFRLQIRGLDTGSANALTLTEDGTAFDLNGNGTDPLGGKTVQQASNAAATIDGFAVTSATNQIVGAIPGVTLALTAKTTSAVTLTVAPDGSQLKTSMQAVVDSFNNAVRTMHTAAGFGATKATNRLLSGDSTIRSMEGRISSAMSSKSSLSGRYTMLAEIGLTLARDGTVSLDSAKLATAVAKDSVSVTALIAEKMAGMAAVVNTLQSATTGTLTNRQTSLGTESTRLSAAIDREQTRLDSYAESLRKRFTQMDTSVAQSKAVMSQLTGYFGTTSSSS